MRLFFDPEKDKIKDWVEEKKGLDDLSEFLKFHVSFLHRKFLVPIHFFFRSSDFHPKHWGSSNLTSMFEDG